MIINIKNLRLRCIIGVFEWERKVKQDIIINVRLEFNGNEAGVSDNIEDTISYKKLNKQIIAFVEKSSFRLVEKLLTEILDIIMEEPKIRQVTVEIDKPGALRFTDSISISDTRVRG